LAIPTEGPQPDPSAEDKTGEQAAKALYGAMHAKDVDISDPSVPIPTLNINELPQCPQCKGLLRPGVVWFGESLPRQTIQTVDEWIHSAPRIDLMLVIGTSAKVWPAAGYVDEARDKGARVAVINMDPNDVPGGYDGLEPGDWFFQGDAGVIVPEILKSVIGEV
jgi:NAD-dependent deacetylase sirtuin 5